MNRFNLVIIGIQEHFQRFSQTKKMHSNQHDLDIVSSSIDQVRFHPSFEKLDQAAGCATAEITFASAVNLFASLGQFDFVDLQKLAWQTDKSRSSVRALGSFQTGDSQSG